MRRRSRCGTASTTSPSSGDGPTPAIARRPIAWAKTLAKRLEPHSSESVYVNYLPEDEGDRVKSLYGEARYRRLVELKKKYDRDNVFRMNANINPKG